MTAKQPFEVDLFWTVATLRSVVSSRFDIAEDSIKLLCKGKLLNGKVADKTLKSLKIKKNDKLILMNRPRIKKSKSPSPLSPPPSTSTSPSTSVAATSSDSHAISHGFTPSNSVDAAIKRRRNIDEIKAAAEKLAQRSNDGYDWSSQHYIELTNQNGQKFHVPDAQRQALTVGVFHNILTMSLSVKWIPWIAMHTNSLCT